MPPAEGLRALADVVRQATMVLRAAGIPEPARDARRLVSGLLGLSAEHLIAEPEREIAPCDLVRLEAALRRRADQREPVSRILGERDFYGRSFLVTPDVLDPRPETECVIDLVLADDCIGAAGGRTREDALRVLDIGTGSGALLVSLLAELPHASGVGSDISPAALEVARANAARLGVADRAAWHLGRCGQGCGATGPFDLIVSNPPYIRTADIASLDAEVQHHDPLLALDGGADGLDVYRCILAAVQRERLLAPDGLLVFEFGAGQAADIAALLAGAGWLDPEPVWRRDIAGHLRCVAVRPRRSP